MNDLKLAFRQLRKSPGFTLIAVADPCARYRPEHHDLQFDQRSVPAPVCRSRNRRALFTSTTATSRAIWSMSEYRRRGSNIIATVRRFLTVSPPRIPRQNSSPFTLTGLGDPVQVFGGRLTSNYFDVLGVRPILGRNFLPEEEEGADVALVTKNFWQKRLGGDPNVIGRSITLDGTPHTIVGVLPNMPATWFGANPIAEVWTTKPFQLPGFSYERLMRGSSFLRVVGRLKPGVTVEQARARCRRSNRVIVPNIRTRSTAHSSRRCGLCPKM